MRKHLRRAFVGFSVATIAGGSVLAGCGSDASQQQSADGKTAGAATPEDGTGELSSDAAPNEAVVAAASWLSGQLQDGLMSTSFENPPGSGKWTTAPDYGLSLDVYFALLGMEDLAGQRRQILDAIEPHAADYVGTGKDAYAGSIGKLVAAVQAADADPAEYADGDLPRRLEGLVATKGVERGRAKDTWDPANQFGGDFSNTIGQSWVVRALGEAGSDLADDTVTFLLKQQCSDGFFRLSMESADHSCDGGTEEESAPSVDATAFAVLAILAAQEDEVEGVEPALESALAAAGDWLVAVQEDDGSYVDAGVANANSTGVAGEALLALGEVDAAAAAANWLREHQVTANAVGKLAGQEGAVAFDDSALQASEKRGITRAVRYQWQRATAQSVAALAPLGDASVGDDGHG